MNDAERKVSAPPVSKSRHIDVISSGRPGFVNRGVSLPFCLYRNQSRYESLLTSAAVGYEDEWGNVITSRKEEYFRDLAPYRQALAITRSSDPEEFPFAVRAVHDTLYSENYDRGQDILKRKPADTVIDCLHYDKSLVVHVGGKYMDTLVLRETKLCRPGLQSGVPAFTLSLGKGESLVQVACVSTARWNTCSHILARTNNQLFHLRTISLSDEMPKTTQKYDVLGRATTMLEPLQQWEFPSNIIDLSVHPARHMCIAYISCRNGNIYQWTASEGVKEVYKGSECLEAEWHNLCSSMHPMVCYKSRGTTLSGLDIRSSKERTIFTDASSLSALCHHTVSPYHLFTCNASSVVSLLDNRYPKRYVFQKFTGEVATDIKFVSTLGLRGGPHHDERLESMFNDPMNGVALTRSAKSQNIFLHCFQLGTTGFEAGEIHTSAIYSATQPFEMRQAAVNCEASAYKVLDRDQPFAKNSGAVFMPRSKDFDTDNLHDKEEKREKSQFYNALLFQQSSIGDVHAQRIEVMASDRDLWTKKCAIGDSNHPLRKSKVNPTDSANSIVTKSEKNVPLKYRKKARKEGTQSFYLYQGLTLKNNIFDVDLDTDQMPVTCADILPRGSDENLDHDVVEVITKPAVEADTNLEIADARKLEEIVGNGLESLFDEQFSCTLSELAGSLKEKYQCKADWNQLRNFLLSRSSEVREYLNPAMKTMEGFENDTSLPPFYTVSGRGKQALKDRVKAEKEMLDADGFPKLYPKCKCLDNVGGICELQNKCLRVHLYVYDRLSIFNALRVSTSSSSSSSSSSSTKATSKTIKLGNESIDPDAILAQLSREWKDNAKKLFKFANN